MKDDRYIPTQADFTQVPFDWADLTADGDEGPAPLSGRAGGAAEEDGNGGRQGAGAGSCCVKLMCWVYCVECRSLMSARRARFGSRWCLKSVDVAAVDAAAFAACCHTCCCTCCCVLQLVLQLPATLLLLNTPHWYFSALLPHNHLFPGDARASGQTRAPVLQKKYCIQYRVAGGEDVSGSRSGDGGTAGEGEGEANEGDIDAIQTRLGSD